MERPTKLTPERQKIIVDAVGVGATFADACAAAGVDYATGRRWMILGERQEGEEFCGFREHRGFCEAVKQAESDAVLESVRTITDAGKKDRMLTRISPPVSVAL